MFLKALSDFKVKEQLENEKLETLLVLNQRKQKYSSTVDMSMAVFPYLEMVLNITLTSNIKVKHKDDHFSAYPFV